MAAAYSTFARSGVYTIRAPITKITDSNETSCWKKNPPHGW
jgi:membrane peptidoglycan carboxypeptidase